MSKSPLKDKLPNAWPATAINNTGFCRFSNISRKEGFDKMVGVENCKRQVLGGLHHSKSCRHDRSKEIDTGVGMRVFNE